MGWYLHKRIWIFAETVVQTCSVKKLFLENSQNSHENTCSRVSFLINKREALSLVFSYEFWEIFKNSFFHRTPPVADSVFVSNSPSSHFSISKFKFCSKKFSKLYRILKLRNHMTSEGEKLIIRVTKKSWTVSVIKILDQ